MFPPAVLPVVVLVVVFSPPVLSRLSSPGGDPSTEPRHWNITPDELLTYIESVTTQSCQNFRVLPVPLPDITVPAVEEKTRLVARLLRAYLPGEDKDLLRRFLIEASTSDSRISEARLLLTQSGSLRTPWFFESARGNGSSSTSLPNEDPPWMIPATGLDPEFWTRPYFVCASGRWMCSFTALLHHPGSRKLAGVLSVDVDVSHLDINQCDVPSSPSSMSAFLRTHKCHNVSTQCLFSAGYGWSVGSYYCRCRSGFYSATLGTPLFNGSLVEVAWRDRQTINSPSYDLLYVCKKCRPGCRTCEDDSSCLSHYNWAFRISLLTISVLCILLTLVLVLYVYRYRKLKVIKVASPIFLSITLLGCAVMYSEMAAIFPVLDMYSCVATKWTRHMGFCITYSALLLKTWRVSLTYRVKSAHKLKLTDKQLLQWLFPILLVMAIYLGTWTISSPPHGVFLVDWNGLRFRQCEFNWWDHSLAIGEFLFLLWGIRVCYTVRHAESFFNEAKHISWAIYNITVVNLIMVLIHVVILPSAEPDVKYLFGFIRTQLSTSSTLSLIFGPKFYRVVKGEGDTWDNRARARGVTASFSLNGVGLVHDEPTDLYQENEELKEEIQKLAAQIEFIKIVHMEMNNRHLKPKHNSFFTMTQSSPIIKSIYMKFESTDSPGSRISPAAELVSERV